MDVTFGDPDDLPQVIENLSLKGYCTLDAAACSPLTSKVLTEVQQRFGVGRFSPPPSTAEVSIADGLLGREGSARIAQLSTADRDGKAVSDLDEFMSELSMGIIEYLPAIGLEASGRSVGLIHETTKAEQPIQELTEMDASNWNGTFSSHRLMILFFLGPEQGMLELSLFGEEAGYSAPQVVTTAANTMVILRPDLISRAHTIVSASKKTFVFSCFVNSMREATVRGAPVPDYREALAQWIQDRMKEIKEMEMENEAVLDDLPKAWVRAMNSQFYRGQQACIRSSGCKLAGPIGWDPDGIFGTNVAGADYIIEVPHRRFHVEEYFYKDPKEELWVEYKTYSRHGSFLDGEDLFDNKQFTVSNQAMQSMQVSERWGLEVGYESLFRAGWNKKKLQRSKGDVLTGVHSTENQLNNKYHDTAALNGGSVAREANMISFTLNIMGQSLTIDTDGSSSLVSVWQGSLEQSDDDDYGRKPPFSLLLGTLCNLCPPVFANFCQRRLLTTRGRCFAFDEKATGFVRGEGCCGAVLDHLYSVVGGEVVVQDNGQGIIRAADMMQCGKGAVLAAPSGVVIHETMSLALRSGGLQPGDVDVLECHAPGSAVHDIPEAVSAGNAMRAAGDTAPLLLTDAKTFYGSAYAGAGLLGVLKVMHCMRNALVGANNMLRQLNPHFDVEDKLLGFVTEPMVLPMETTGFSAVNSFGNSGTYVTAIIWADRMQLFMPPPDEGKGPSCVFWPGGGGELEESAVPKEAYYLAGSFSQWANPIKMEETVEASGEWTATIVLGENSFEQFQIWLDGGEDRVVHPGRPRAPRHTAVVGPEERSACSLCTWQIDARPLLVYEGGEIKELPNKDKSPPGTQFLVRLRVAGKYRTVDWERLAEPLGTPAPSSYFLVSSWNGWEFQEMTIAEADVWTIEATLDGAGGDFAIVRNRDWGQAFYPADFSNAGRDVYGPDDWGRGLTWTIEGDAGGVYEIRFRRKVKDGEDERDVSWKRSGGSAVKTPARSASTERRILSPHCVSVDLDALS